MMRSIKLLLAVIALASLGGVLSGCADPPPPPNKQGAEFDPNKEYTKEDAENAILQSRGGGGGEESAEGKTEGK